MRSYQRVLRVVCLGLLGLSAPQSYALTESDFAACAVTEGDLARLSCFDKLAEDEGLDGPQALPAPVEGTGKWDVSRTKNPIDDSETVVIALEADQGASRFNGPVLIVARCQSDQTELYINWGEYLGNDGSFRDEYKEVIVRVGSEDAVTQRWGLSTSNESTFAPDWAGDLLKVMVNHNSLVAQTTPYNENPVTAVFDTTGLSGALEPLMAACDWSLSD